MIYDLTFFFFINIIGLNMIFGIIIDTFGELRDIENEKQNTLRRTCLVCGMSKTQFESLGVSFIYHTRLQHNIEDYVAYLIRLLINKDDLYHDLDYYIYENFANQNVSWLPNQGTIFIRSLQRLLEDDQDRRLAEQERTIIDKVAVVVDKVAYLRESLEGILKRVEEFTKGAGGTPGHAGARSEPRKFHFKIGAEPPKQKVIPESDSQNMSMNMDEL